MRFTQTFAEELIQESECIEVRCQSKDSEEFDIYTLKTDLKQLQDFKKRFKDVIEVMEAEIFDKQTAEAIEDLEASGPLDLF